MKTSLTLSLLSLCFSIVINIFQNKLIAVQEKIIEEKDSTCFYERQQDRKNAEKERLELLTKLNPCP